MEAFNLEDAPDKPLPRDVARAMHAKGISGRPSKFSQEVAESIIESVRKGAFLSAAGGRVGVSLPTVRDWILRGNADYEADLDTDFAKFAQAVHRAQADHEAELAASFTRGGDGKFPDWRAQAFIAERRYEHWRLPKEQAFQGVTLALSNEQLASLGEALKVASLTPINSKE